MAAGTQQVTHALDGRSRHRTRRGELRRRRVYDFRTALRSNFDADNSNCSVDVVVGSLSARFQVSAERVKRTPSRLRAES